MKLNLIYWIVNGTENENNVFSKEKQGKMCQRVKVYMKASDKFWTLIFIAIELNDI